MSMICPKGYKCASGHCHPVICGSSIYDCPPGYSCSQGICIPIGTECSKLTPCKIRTDKCVHGRCLNVCQIFGTQNCKCSSFNQCTCKSSKDCDVGHLCRPKHGKNKYCTPATCKNDDDCDDGMVCEGRKCTKMKPCTSSQDCPGNRACYKKKCITPPANCDKDEDCNHPKICTCFNLK